MCAIDTVDTVGTIDNTVGHTLWSLAAGTVLCHAKLSDGDTRITLATVWDKAMITLPTSDT